MKITDFEIFISKVAAKMKLRGLHYSDLAEMTGYKLSTINLFFSNRKDRKRSRFVARKLSEVLKIKL